MLTTCPIGDIIIKSPRARATKTAHSGNEIKQINNGLQAGIDKRTLITEQ